MRTTNDFDANVESDFKKYFLSIKENMKTELWMDDLSHNSSADSNQHLYETPRAQRDKVLPIDKWSINHRTNIQIEESSNGNKLNHSR